MTVSDAEQTAITEVVQAYIDRSRSGDADQLRGAFHPDARIYGSIAGQRFDLPIDELFALASVSRRMSTGPTRRASCPLSRSVMRRPPRSRRPAFGHAVVHRLLLAVALRRRMEDREQDLRPHRRGAPRALSTSGSGSPAQDDLQVVTHEDIVAAAFADGSEREPIVHRCARSSSGAGVCRLDSATRACMHERRSAPRVREMTARRRDVGLHGQCSPVTRQIVPARERCGEPARGGPQIGSCGVVLGGGG
jgi:hypothetical protein